MDEDTILGAVSLQKDVDGFHPLNMGNLALRGREPLFIPCAAKACIELLLRSGIKLKGKNVAVIGRSNVVGLPTTLLLQVWHKSSNISMIRVRIINWRSWQRHHATVSVVHAFTNNPEDVTRVADIVISAAGVPNLVRGSWLKRGAIVIDVGTNPIEVSFIQQVYWCSWALCLSTVIDVERHFMTKPLTQVPHFTFVTCFIDHQILTTTSQSAHAL